MSNEAKKKEAALALKSAHKDLRDAYNRMHHARARLEELDPESQDFINHQSDSGALWAMANQVSAMRTTINQIVKAIAPKEKT